MLDGLRSLPDESVQCVVTSPPYWALRDYGAEGQLGLEATPDEHVSRMADVFDEVRRVLRSDGTCWVNYGDSFNDKQLVGIPWRFAFEMQRRGWWLRSDIIWAKPNPMPESVVDRPTKAHEYVFLFTKSGRYFYDADAVKEDAVIGRVDWHGDRYKAAVGSAKKNPEHGSPGHDLLDKNTGRNARTVWTIATQPYADAHFATFPEELPRRCIAAGTSERGACAECGAPWGRDVETTDEYRLATRGTHFEQRIGGAGSAYRKGGTNPATLPPKNRTIGWSKTCSCATDAKPRPCVVLDPFAGSGTTLAVACGMGRDAIGIELNPEYARLAEDRIGKALRPSTHVSLKDAPAPLFQTTD